jgi:hypothetical protein
MTHQISIFLSLIVVILDVKVKIRIIPRFPNKAPTELERGRSGDLLG